MSVTTRTSPAPAAGLSAIDRDSSFYGTLFIIIAACLAVLAFLLLPGCGDPSRAHAVNEPTAREALKTALDGWKKGETPSSFATASSPMIVQDFEWQSGAKLIDYQLVDRGKPYDANLRIQVKLKLDGAKGQAQIPGKSAEKTVWYLVGTSPKVTVFRDMLRK
jgi:hypothetical protein